MMSNGPDRELAINDETATLDTLNGLNYMVYDPSNGTISGGDLIVNNLNSGP